MPVSPHSDETTTSAVQFAGLLDNWTQVVPRQVVVSPARGQASRDVQVYTYGLSAAVEYVWRAGVWRAGVWYVGCAAHYVPSKAA